MSDTPVLASDTDYAAGLAASGHAILARRYADALYALAAQDNAIDAVAADLKKLDLLWNQSPEWRHLAADPRLTHPVIIEAAAQVSKSCGLGKLAASFLGVAARRRRLSVLPAIIAAFLDKVAQARGEHRAEVRAARPLSAAQTEKLTAALTAATGGKIHLAVTEDASILGGLTVKLGSQLIDASVRTRLDLLERQLKGAA
ncbi:MAG: ATP synthase F1 subunit delta [Alphaproteobacteria bacterium]|nr:ATP synthase F1 subunit delta [Alphaproteobacteria bacterium]